MLHDRLQEIEAELAAKEQSKLMRADTPPECIGILDYVERDIEVRLADKVPRDWKGWVCYRRHNKSMIIVRGRAFKQGMMGELRAGFDHDHGLDTMREHQRGFDVSPPQDLDHLLINFGIDGERFRVFLWYGEHIAAYKLIFAANVDDDPHHELSSAIIEACIWIVRRPKHQTLEDFLREPNS